MNNLMLWEEGGTGTSGEQKLFLDKFIRQFYLSRPQQSDRDNFNVEFSGNKNWWKDNAYSDSGRSKHQLHYTINV